MIMPPGHGRPASAGRALSRRERWLVGAMIAVVAALALILVVAIGSGGRSSGHGCIYATIPGPVGAQEIYQCGGQARATCQSASVGGSFRPQAARVIEEQCRRAGLAGGAIVP